MRQFLSFWRLAFRNALRNNTSFANDWAWLVGVPAASFLGAYVSARSGSTGMSTGYPILDGLVAAAAAFLITWLASLLIRLANEPVALFHAQKDRADAAEARWAGSQMPTSDTWLQDGIFYLMHSRWPVGRETAVDDSMTIESVQTHIKSIKHTGAWATAETALLKMRQSAKDGALTVWGKPMRASMTILGKVDEKILWDRIDPEHWQQRHITPDQLVWSPEQMFTTDVAGDALPKDSFCALRVCRAQMEAIWPTEQK